MWFKLLTFLQIAKSQKCSSEIGNFLLPNNVKIRWAHVQDLSFDMLQRSWGSNEMDGFSIADSIEKAYLHLKSKFAEFDITVRGVVDKSQTVVDTFTKNTYPMSARCDDKIGHEKLRLYPEPSHIYTSILDNTLSHLKNPANYIETGHRPDLFDAVYHQISDWAEEDAARPADDTKVVNLISIQTDQCPREGMIYDIAKVMKEHDVMGLFLVNDTDGECKTYDTNKKVSDWWNEFYQLLYDQNVSYEDPQIDSNLDNLSDKMLNAIDSLICEKAETWMTKHWSIRNRSIRHF